MTSSSVTADNTLPRRALSREVADRLCARIRNERLAPDTVLGTEAELAEQFGVSRTVIREAVGQLRGLGLVTSRQGLGLCVATTDVFDTMSKSLGSMLSDESTWRELCHIRFVLEVGSLPLAVERAAPEQIGLMRRLAEEMLRMVERPDRSPAEVEEYVAEREIQFHQIVFDAAGSEFASRFHQVVAEYFHESYGVGPHATPPTEKDMRDHLQLVQAIVERDVRQAHAILVDHIRHTIPPDGDDSTVAGEEVVNI